MHRRLADAADLIAEERFDARVGPECRYCPFRGACPAQPVGKQVVALRFPRSTQAAIRMAPPWSWGL